MQVESFTPASSLEPEGQTIGNSGAVPPRSKDLRDRDKIVVAERSSGSSGARAEDIQGGGIVLPHQAGESLDQF